MSVSDLATHFILFRNGSLLRMWVAQALSQSAQRVLQIAVLWWMMTDLHDYQPGTVSALFLVFCTLPAVLFAKRIGALVDRHSPRVLLSASALLAAGTLLIFALSFVNSWFPVGVAMSIGFLVSAAHAAFDPALQRGVGQLVESKDVPSAIALVTSTQSLANFGGAVVGAFLLETFGMLPLIGIVSAAYFCAALLAFSLRQKSMERAEVTETQPPADSSPVRAADSGWSLVKRYPLFDKILIAFGLINFFTTPAMVILPLYVRQILGGTARNLGLLEACIWIGLLIGSVAAPRLVARRHPLVVATVCIGAMGLSLLLPGLIISTPLYAVSLFLTGFTIGLNNSRFIVLFQETVADDVKGRFFALLQAIVSSTVPVAFLGFGALANLVSPRWLCLIQGTGTVALATYFLFLFRQKSSRQLLSSLAPKPPPETLYAVGE